MDSTKFPDFLIKFKLSKKAGRREKKKFDLWVATPSIDKYFTQSYGWQLGIEGSEIFHPIYKVGGKPIAGKLNYSLMEEGPWEPDTFLESMGENPSDFINHENILIFKFRATDQRGYTHHFVQAFHYNSKSNYWMPIFNTQIVWTKGYWNNRARNGCKKDMRKVKYILKEAKKEMLKERIKPVLQAQLGWK